MKEIELFIEKMKKIEEMFSVNRYYFSYVIPNVLPNSLEDIPVFEEYMEQQKKYNQPLFKLIVRGDPQNIEKIEQKINFNNISKKMSVEELPVSGFNNYKKESVVTYILEDDKFIQFLNMTQQSGFKDLKKECYFLSINYLHTIDYMNYPPSKYQLNREERIFDISSESIDKNINNLLSEEFKRIENAINFSSSVGDILYNKNNIEEVKNTNLYNQSTYSLLSSVKDDVEININNPANIIFTIKQKIIQNQQKIVKQIYESLYANVPDFENKPTLETISSQVFKNSSFDIELSISGKPEDIQKFEKKLSIDQPTENQKERVGFDKEKLQQKGIIKITEEKADLSLSDFLKGKLKVATYIINSSKANQIKDILKEYSDLEYNTYFILQNFKHQFNENNQHARTSLDDIHSYNLVSNFKKDSKDYGLNIPKFKVDIFSSYPDIVKSIDSIMDFQLQNLESISKSKEYKTNKNKPN